MNRWSTDLREKSINKEVHQLNPKQSFVRPRGKCQILKYSLVLRFVWERLWPAKYLSRGWKTTAAVAEGRVRGTEEEQDARPLPKTKLKRQNTHMQCLELDQYPKQLRNRHPERCGKVSSGSSTGCVQSAPRRVLVPEEKEGRVLLSRLVQKSVWG